MTVSLAAFDNRMETTMRVLTKAEREGAFLLELISTWVCIENTGGYGRCQRRAIDCAEDIFRVHGKANTSK
jgi:hypothetical protein